MSHRRTDHRTCVPERVAKWIAAYVATIIVLIGVQVFGGVDPEYDVATVRPNFQHDADTTLLIDFQRAGKHWLKHSAVEWNPAAEMASINPGSGLVGTLAIPLQGHLNPARFTLELLLKPGPDSTSRTVIAECSALRQFTTQLSLGRFAISAKEMETAVNIGGNGFGIERDAAEQWVYLAVGADLASGQIAAVARNIEGRLIRERLEYSNRAGVLADVDSAVFDRLQVQGDPAAQAPVSWRQVADLVQQLTQKGNLSAIKLGHEQVTLGAVRVSSGFRSDILRPRAEPRQRGGMVLTNIKIDKSLARSVVVSRTLGTSQHNQTPLGVLEDQIDLIPGGPAMKVNVPEMPAGLYAVHLFGQIDPKGDLSPCL